MCLCGLFCVDEHDCARRCIAWTFTNVTHTYEHTRTHTCTHTYIRAGTAAPGKERWTPKSNVHIWKSVSLSSSPPFLFSSLLLCLPASLPLCLPAPLPPFPLCKWAQQACTRAFALLTMPVASCACTKWRADGLKCANCRRDQAHVQLCVHEAVCVLI